MGNCGSGLTKPCLAESDKRYDQSASIDLLDQDPIWTQFSGYWGPSVRKYILVNNGGKPRQPTFFNPATKSGWPFRSDQMTVFRVITIEGSRFKDTSFYFYEPAPTEFCNQTVPEGKTNNIGDGVCGENGSFQLIEDFGVSSYEKDASINLIWKNQGPVSDEISGPSLAETSTLSPADDFGVFVYYDMGILTKAETFTFGGEDSNFMLTTATATLYEPTDENFQRIIGESIGPRIAGDEAEFLSALRKAFEDHKVKSVPEWLSAGDPMPECVAESWGTCPNETAWCEAGRDPSCSVSPYQEPPASLSAGGIVLIVFACVAFAFGAAYYYYNNKLKSMEKRYKRRFVETVVQDVKLERSDLQLGPDQLADLFRKIDEDGNGTIGKEELWEFVSSGKAGIMDAKDFNALFNSMDVDESGMVDFMEFCGFMATCGKTYKRDSVQKIVHSQNAAAEIAKLIDDKKDN